MQRFNLPTSDNGDRVQIFPLVDGQVNITGAEITDVIGVACVLDGDIIVDFPINGATTISLLAGDQYGFLKPVNIEVDSATIHYVKAGN